MKKIIYLFLLLQLAITSVWAESAFVINKIEFQGLQRVPAVTVESYLPVKRGDILHAGKTAAILKDLYKTGFFEHITLSERNGTLIIHVVERPTIGQLKITGNSIIPTDKLTQVMKTLDIAEGRVYNPAVLERITQSLINQYYMLGRYNARVDVRVTPMARNRVMVQIMISEGVVAKVQRISIIGNKVFDDSTLIKQMDLAPSGVFSFMTQTDRYSEEKLAMSLDKIRNYYMDHGYLKFEIKSSQAQVTPDRKTVYITIVVSEGEPYTVEKYDLGGNLILPRQQIIDQIRVKPGETFSRQKVIDTQKDITKLLGDKGYLFAAVSVLPNVNEKNHTVSLVFTVKPGKLAYVRHVTFTDNTRTNDVVLRREIEQMEAAPASTGKLEESKHRLNLLPFIKETEMSVKPVPGRDDQVDVDYKVKEDSSAQATVQIGYSQLYRTILGAGINQKNFLGTGNTLGVNLRRSKFEQNYAINYTDPYYTADGISRTFSFSINRTDPGAASNVTSGYTTNQYDLGVLYGIPIGQEHGVYNQVLAGIVYQDTLINVVNAKASAQVNAFVNNHGTRFHELDFRLGYSRNSLDKAIFPTRGMFQSVFVDAFAPVANDSLSFYMANYSGKWYLPLNEQFIVLARGDLAYGNGLNGINDYPFFRNFFAGGIGSVRGYQVYTLGPHDSNGLAFGGNMLADASLGLIFPNYLSESLRTSVFVDAGNVYTSLNNRAFGGQSSNSGPIRYSTGIEADLITPFGPIQLSLAKAINPRSNHGGIKGDSIDVFQFALGANF